MSTLLREETAYLQAYDKAFKTLDSTLDIRGNSLALLLRFCFQSGGRLSNHRRKQYVDHVSPEAFDMIEATVQQARIEFGLDRK